MKKNRTGKRNLQTPLSQTLAETEFYPITQEDFARVVKKAIPPSPQPDPAETQTSAD